MEGLPPRRSRAIRGDDARYPRVHPPLSDACIATGLPPHPLLRPADQPDTCQQHRPYPHLARDSAHPSRRHQGRHLKAGRAADARASLPMLRQPHAHHRDLLAGATAQAPPDATSGEDPDRHLMMTFAKPSPRKAVCLSGRASAGHGSGHSDAAFTTQQPHRSPPIHRPADRKNASPPTCIDILTAQSTLAADLSCGPPTPKSPSKRAGTAQYVTFLAVSSLEGFQTPAAVRVGMFVTAGVWKPSQKPTLARQQMSVTRSPHR